MPLLRTEGLYAYLRLQYEGVMDPENIEAHIKEHIEPSLAEEETRQVLEQIGGNKRVLDIGAGFGAFVLTSRQAGLDAIGIEIAPFEVDYARDRLRNVRPEDDPETIYLLGSGLDLPFKDEEFDAVTLWNVAEHVPNYRRLLHEAVRVLAKGGRLFLLAPNYAAFRMEAHYHVLWPPLLPRFLALPYLRLRKRNPNFFQHHIFYCTNSGILKTLSRLPVTIMTPDLEKIQNPDNVRTAYIRKLIKLLNHLALGKILASFLWLRFRNPFKSTINIQAIKRGGK